MAWYNSQSNKIKDLQKTVAQLQKKAMSFPGLNIGSAPVYFSWEKDADAYVTNDSVYTIIKRTAQKASSVPLYSYKTKENLKRYKSLSSAGCDFKKLMIERVKALDERDESSNLSKLLMRPNPNQGADAFYEGVFSFYFLKGESFIWLNRGGVQNGEVLEMYIIPPSKITIVADEQDLYGLKYYLLDIGGKAVRIEKEDILHWKTFNPEFDAYTRSHMRGFDPMKPLKRRLQQDNDSMDAAVAMFQNGGAKGVIFEKSLIDLTPQQDSQLQRVVDTKLNNKEQKAAIAQLQGDWGYLYLGLNSVDMQLLGAQELTLKRLCAAFGFPYEFFQSDTTFANKEMAQKGWVSNIIMSACYSFRDEFNRAVTSSFKSGFVDFEFDMLPEMQEDVKEMGATYALLHDRGVINTDEFRELTGFEPSGNPIHKQFMYNGIPIEDTLTPAEDNTNSKWNDYEGES